MRFNVKLESLNMGEVPKDLMVIREIRKEFPGFEVRQKSTSTLMRAIDLFLKVITLWRMRYFLTRFTTTMGRAIFVPSNWFTWSEESRAAILRHERVHLRQARKYGRFLFSVLYLLPFLPIGLAWWRTKFEMEAYEESMRAHHEYGWDIRHLAYKESIIRHFTTHEYLWMWPFRTRIEAWVHATVDRVIDEAARTQLLN